MPESQSASIEINAVPEELFEIVTDLESYPEWLEGIERVTVDGETEDGFPARSEMVTDIKVRTVTYTLEYEYEYPTVVSWKSLPGGDVKQIDGRYRFVPVDDETTRVEYELTIDPGFPVPGMMVRRIAKYVMHAALDGLKERAEAS